MRSFERSLPSFAARGVQIAAISVDSSEESRNLCRSRGYTFPFLSDPEAGAIRAYGVLHPGAGPGEHDIARPAEFLVDVAKNIRWENLTGSVLARLRPEVALLAIDRLSDRGSPSTPR